MPEGVFGKGRLTLAVVNRRMDLMKRALAALDLGAAPALAPRASCQGRKDYAPDFRD